MSGANWSKGAQKLYRQRWRIWIIACLAHAIVMFHRAAIAPMADQLMADFGLNAVAFGGLAAVYFYIYAAMQLPSGILADTMGPRKTITAGLLLSGAGSVLMSLAPSFGILYVGRIIVSFGVSIVWLSAIKLVMEWFRRQELATITGFTVSLANLGLIAASTPLALLIISVGWRMSLMIASLATFALAAANWFIIRNSPIQIGLSPIEPEEQAVPQGAASLDSLGLSLAQKLKSVLRNKSLWPLFLLGLGTYGAYATLFHNWAVVYLMQTYGIQRGFATNFILVATIGVMVGGPLVGYLSDRFFQQRRRPAVAFTGITLASFLLVTFWNGGRPPLGALYPLCFFAGLGVSSCLLTFAYIKDTVQPSLRGTASGLVNTGAFVGAALAQPLFGYILDLGWRGEMMEGVRVYPVEAFQHGLLLCSVLAALGFVGALLMKREVKEGSTS
ncbi:putative sulfoacetate transporter SauU [subsurface metagenome]